MAMRRCHSIYTVCACSSHFSIVVLVLYFKFCFPTHEGVEIIKKTQAVYQQGNKNDNHLCV